MRGTPWLILVAILAILGASGIFYLQQRTSIARREPAKPRLLSPDTNSTAIDYEYGQSTSGLPSFKVRAKGYRQIRDTQNYELTGLELQLMRKDHEHYDLIKSAHAEFNQTEGRMYSAGEVEITLDVPINGTPPHQLTWIKSSGVTFDSKTGKAVTDQPAEFRFENGQGKCVGAGYDPSTRELHLLHDPELTLQGKGPNSKPMHVRAGEILYKEADSVVWLSPWSKMTREESSIDAAATVINLSNGQIDSIDAHTAQGVDNYPHRELRYSADTLHVAYDENGKVRQIQGNGNARLRSVSEGAATETRSDHANLDFRSENNEAILTHVLATGKAEIESKPARDASGKTAETRLLKSESLEVNMRPGGREIEQVKALAPGILEFIPNAPDQHHRLLNGEHMLIGYGVKNSIRSFDTDNATTITFPAEAAHVKNPLPSRTASRKMQASFDEHGQLATLKQWDHFTYEEGARKARADSATLDNQASVMNLENHARIWDEQGSTDAGRIRLQQKTGDYTAEEHVMTSRMPDQDGVKKKSGDLLGGDDPVQGMAPRMTSANRNRLIHYEGGAVVWQGADRIEAQTIDIDRIQHVLTAVGKVSTQFLDQNKDDDTESQSEQKESSKARPSSADQVKLVKVAPAQASTATSGPVYTVVKADQLVYTDNNRLAHYTGNVLLTRPGLRVKSGALDAYLNDKDSDADSRLNHAFAENGVEIVDSRLDRQRTGRGDHGEYYTEEDKLILRGNLAELTDSLKGDSRGTQLTYYTSDDRLVISGSPSQPVNSRLHRKLRNHADSGNR